MLTISKIPGVIQPPLASTTWVLTGKVVKSIELDSIFKIKPLSINKSPLNTSLSPVQILALRISVGVVPYEKS